MLSSSKFTQKSPFSNKTAERKNSSKVDTHTPKNKKRLENSNWEEYMLENPINPDITID